MIACSAIAISASYRTNSHAPRRNAMELSGISQIFDFIGTFAFAISGIRLASARRFDLFGAYVVGLTTAVGGGTVRDLMLGLTPFWMETPTYVVCTAFAVLWVAIFGKALIRQNNTWFIFDTIGLAVFTVTGMEKTLALGFPGWTAIIMGTMTGAAGGVFRDVFINVEPLIFRKEIYASACVLGGLAYLACGYAGWGSVTAGIVCSVSVIVIRLLAVKYHLSLPHLRGED